MRTLTLICTGLLAATGAWTAVMAAGLDAHSDVALVLMAISLWVATVVAVAGMLVARARWARRLGLAVTASHGVIALLVAPDLWWGVAAIMSAVIAVGIGGPWLDGLVRDRAAASGPPARAVLLPLVLIGVPFALGVSRGDGATAVIVGLSALGTAYWFIRTLPGALLSVRVLWPAVGLIGAVPLGWPAGVTAATAGVAVAALAWDSSVRNAVHPLVEQGTVVRIPPELAPKDVLDAAELDDRGRPS